MRFQTSCIVGKDYKYVFHVNRHTSDLTVWFVKYARLSSVLFKNVQWYTGPVNCRVVKTILIFMKGRLLVKSKVFYKTRNLNEIMLYMWNVFILSWQH